METHFPSITSEFASTPEDDAIINKMFETGIFFEPIVNASYAEGKRSVGNLIKEGKITLVSKERFGRLETKETYKVHIPIALLTRGAKTPEFLNVGDTFDWYKDYS